MTKPAAQYVREQALAGAIVNMLLNGGIAWLLYRRVSAVPLAGDHGIIGDLLATGLLIPLLVSAVVSPLIKRDSGRGRVDPPHAPPATFVRRLPDNPLGLGLALALSFGFPAAALALGLLALLGVEELSFARFAAFKAGFAGLLAYGVTRVVVHRAMLSQPAGMK